jgi:hypothetical protein
MYNQNLNLQAIWDWNKYLYGVAAPDLILAQNTIVEFMVQNRFSTEAIYYGKANHESISENHISKGQLKEIIQDKMVVIILLKDYLKHYYHWKDLKKYIFILDLSIYNLNRIENIEIINHYSHQSINQKHDNSDPSVMQFSTTGLYSYFQRENYYEHCKIISSALERGDLSWQYIKDNYVFLNAFIPELIINLLMNKSNDMFLSTLKHNIIPGKAILLLCEYEHCKNSFFPEKKTLICNYLYNMLLYIST